MENHDEGRALLWDLIKDIKFAMLTTHHEDGRMHSRPMTTQNSELTSDDCLWFFMSRKSESLADMLRDSNVALSYAHPGKDSYVSVSGIGHLDNDPERIRALWTKFAEAWFPGGPTDPDLALVEVRITHAHYWDVKESKITQLLKIAKATVTGTPPANMGESGEVRMTT